MAKIVSEVIRGMAEGAGKKAVEKGTEKAEKLKEQTKTAIKTNFLGLGPEDEAKFNLAFKELWWRERIILTNFMNFSLSGSERNWFRRVIAEMKATDGTKILRQLIAVSDDERKKTARAMGLVKFGPLEETCNSILEKIKNRKKAIEKKKADHTNHRKPNGKLERKYRFRFLPF